MYIYIELYASMSHVCSFLHVGLYVSLWLQCLSSEWKFVFGGIK